ncbi:MAG: lysophospholipid acyltransferase family protein [Alistipes sp.]
MKANNLTFFERCWLECLWLGCKGFAALPYWIRYFIIENVIFFFLYVMRYRMKVVKTNLRNSFPEKSDYELLVLRHKFYRTLAELFVDTLSLAGIDDEKGRRVLKIKNLEEHRKLVSGRDWIAMAAHFGCWEYYAFWGLFDPTQMLVAIYHPLHSKVMELFYQRLRIRRYTMTVAMHDCMRFYIRNKDAGIDGRNIVLGMISDQNPPRRPDSHWFHFLHQDTIFFDGSEKLARKCHLPVFFVHSYRDKRGYYEISFEQIYDGKEEVADNEITERYVRRLEAMIVERPELWMWSHRRWKHKKEVDCN